MDRNIFGHYIDPEHPADWVIDVGTVARRVGRQRGEAYLRRAIGGIIRDAWRGNGVTIDIAKGAFAALSNYFVSKALGKAYEPPALENSPAKKRPTDEGISPVKKKRAIEQDNRPTPVEYYVDAVGNTSGQATQDKLAVAMPTADAGTSTENTQQGLTDTPILKQKARKPKFYDVHTGVCGLDMYWCWVFNTSYAQQNALQFSLSSIYNPIVSGTSEFGTNTSITITGEGKYCDYKGLTTSGTQFGAVNRGAPFPYHFGNSATEVLRNRTFYEKLYDYYHVTRCNWEIIIENPMINSYQDVMILYGVEVSGTTTGGVVYPTSASLDEMLRWPGIQSKLIPSPALNAGDRGIYKISGSYVPGTATRSVVNDGEAKNWTAMGASPSITELLKVWVFRAPFSGLTGTYAYINCHLNLSYEVQFRDLKTAVYYPTSQATSSTLNVPADFLQYKSSALDTGDMEI